MLPACTANTDLVAPTRIVHQYEDLPEIAHEAGRPNEPPLGEMLKTVPLEELLRRDQARAAQSEERVRWFHGRLDRETAVRVLRENGNSEGLFLVRESGVGASSTFVVSIIQGGQPLHFQIYSRGDVYYQLSHGPLFRRLDALIDFYVNGEHGLRTKFETFCKGQAPPAKTRQKSQTNTLQRAVSEGDVDVTRRILRSPLCPSLDARDADGQTALHLAACKARAEIAEALIVAGATVDCKDGESLTPLYTACRHDQALVCKLLLQMGADPTVRQYGTAYVPLHQAAKSGHVGCVKELLLGGAPCHPRTVDDDTPLDLARRSNHREVVKVLERYQPPCPRTIRGYWDHGTLSQNMAAEVLAKHGAKSGQFLVRNFYSLTMVANDTMYNFEINQKGDRFFIGDGPYFDTMEHLVEYYTHFDDGFHVRLTRPVSPGTSSSKPHGDRDDQYVVRTAAARGAPPLASPRQSPGSSTATNPEPEGHGTSGPSGPSPLLAVAGDVDASSNPRSHVTIRYLNVNHGAPRPASPASPRPPTDEPAGNQAPTSWPLELDEEFPPSPRLRRFGRLFGTIDRE